jgi:uncharacterized membrane protein
MFSTKAMPDTLRTLAFGSVGATFSAVGPSFAFQSRIICFTNTTNEDVIFSINGTVDQLIVPAGSFKLFDITMNHRPVNMDDFVFAIGTQWYVRYASAAPTSGAVYIEVIYAQPY